MSDAPQLESIAVAEPQQVILQRLARGHLPVFLGCACLAMLASWPLLQCLGEYLGDSDDPLYSATNFAWIAHSIVGNGGSLWDENLFYPNRQTLALGEPSLINAFVALPFIALTHNPILGHNVAVLFALTMAGFGAYLLTWDLLRERGPALLAGLIFATSPFLLHNAFNIQSLSCYWLPFLYLALERFRREPTWSRAALCWCAATLLVLSSIYFTFYGGIILLIMGVTGMVAAGHRWSVRHLLRLGAVSVPFIAGVVWTYLPYLSWYGANETSRTLEDAATSSARLANFVMVPAGNLLHRWLGIFVPSNTDTSPLYPGVVAAGMALLGIAAVVRRWPASNSPAPRVPRQAAIPHVAALISAFLLSFGPSVKVAGLAVPMPYQWLYWVIPGFKALRTPNRFGAPMLLAVAVLAAVGFTLLRKYLRARGHGGWQRAVGIGVPVLVALEFATFPFPGTAQSYPNGRMIKRWSVIEWLRDVEGRGAVLELPRAPNDVVLYEAGLHLKPVVAGFSSFNPFLYEEAMAVLNTFPSQGSWALLHSLPLDYVMIRKGEFSGAAMTDIGGRPEIMRFERDLRTHLIFRAAAPSSSMNGLTLAAAVAPQAGGAGSARLIASVANGTGQPLPFYPLHTLTTEVSSDGERICRQQQRLPLFLGNDAVRFECPLPPEWARDGKARPALEVKVDVSSMSGARRQLEQRIAAADTP